MLTGACGLRIAHGSSTELWIGPRQTEAEEVDFTNPQLRPHFSCVERVTGIEPALSAWELLERMGMCLVLYEFRGLERPGVSLGCLP